MTIDEVKQAKRELENAIHAMLLEFQNKTGVAPVSIDLRLDRSLVRRLPVVSQVSIEVQM